MRIRKLITQAAHFTIIALSLLSLSASITIASAQEIGEKANIADFVTFDGQTVKPEELQGRPVLLYFWASWCPNCIVEMPLLNDIYEEYHSKGLEILAVNVEEEIDKATSFYKRKSFMFPGGPMTPKYKINYPSAKGTPSWFLVDKEGIIRAKVLGRRDLRWTLEKALLPLL